MSAVDEITEVRRLRLEPGDVIVCRFSEDMRHVRDAHIQTVRDLLKERFPNHEVVVLGPGIDLEVMTPAGDKRGA